MSIRVMTVVWDSGLCSGNELLTLLALADWSNDNGLSWPNLASLGKKTRQSERNVRYTLRQLETAEILAVAPVESGRRHYQINLENLQGAKIAGGNHCRSGGQNLPVRGAKCDSAIRKNRHGTVIKQPSGGESSPDQSFELAKKLAHDLGIPSAPSNLKAIQGALETESEFSRLSLPQAALLIYDSATKDCHLQLSGKAPAFYFQDVHYRQSVKYMTRQLVNCELHPGGGLTQRGTCYGCYAQIPPEPREIVCATEKAS
jgi:hypothetical protein